MKISFNDPRHIETMLASIKEEEKRRTHDRREARKKGGLSPSLREKLGACNELQLRRVKKLCNQHIASHRKAPSSSECGKSFVAKVIMALDIKNRRYQLEMRRSSLRSPKIYVNGPYLYEYWRDGQFVRQKYLGNGSSPGIPRKVKAAIREHLDPAAIAIYKAEFEENFTND